METKTIKVYEPDKEWITEKAEVEGVTQAEVIAKAIEEYADVVHHHACPECSERFTLDDVDTSTVRETGAVNTDVRYLLRGDREVKDFECPECSERVAPEDAEMDTPVPSGDVSEKAG